MVARLPYDSIAAIHDVCDEIMDRLEPSAWQDAFACHPMLGDLESLRMKYAGNKDWSRNEQSGVTMADEATLIDLANLNLAYRQKFGFIFILCATGKSAADMLSSIKSRIGNSLVREIANAADEQRKITHLRIDKMEVS